VPFIVAGGGALGVTSPDYAVGNDIDPAFHFGVGAKAYINRRFVVRLDLRDNLSPKVGLSGGAANSFEVLLGLSFTLFRERDKDEPDKPDPAPEPDARKDTDGDGFADPDDKCPKEPGVAPDGCPLVDTDGDGFADPDDECPQEPGIAPKGCPDRDPDKDGVLDPDDKCPYEPETVNGHLDEDGCPDVPPEVLQFEGVLPGINFEVGKASLQADSAATLDKVVETLVKHATTRVEISGHTDTTGSRELNMELSRARAQSVKEYLVDHGVDAGRIETRGAGPDEPIDSNASPAGRANNRRIEFRTVD
jgi:OOP family OmpA-OmpF porin